MDVRIEPDEIARRIREYARSHPELIYDRYRPGEVSLQGACYMVSESYYHAKGARESGLEIYCLSWDDVTDYDTDSTHWFLRDGVDGRVVDLGLDHLHQAETIPFEAGTHRSFLTGYDVPSNRTKTVLDDLEIDY